MKNDILICERTVRYNYMQLILPPEASLVRGIVYLETLKWGGTVLPRWDSFIRLSLSFIADVMLVQPRVEFILSFIDHIAGDEDHTDGVVACAAGLIG